MLRRVAILFLAPLLLFGHMSSAQVKAAPGKTDSAPEAVLIEELSTSVRFERDGSRQQVVRQRTKILTEAGLRQYGIISFNFISGQQFKLDTLEVHKKDGTVVKAGPANIQETTPEISRLAPVYSDLRQKQVTVPGLGVGDEIVFQYSTTAAPITPGQFWFQYSFRKNVAVNLESLAVDIPGDVKIQLHFLPEYKPEIKQSGGRILYRWTSSAPAPQATKEKQRTNLEQLATGTVPPPSIELSTFRDWEQVGSWYYGLQRDRVAVTPAIKAKALELTAGLPNPEAKVKALYQFVSLNFRYIGLDFGIGRYQPHPAEEVLANKYGDCKDKHTLFAALLAAAGIQAYPVLINAGRELDPLVPSPAQFDHVLTAVPLGNRTVFLDTTEEVAPYGMLLLPLRNKKALLVTGASGSHFVQTPSELPFHAQESFDLNGKLDPSGTLEADVSYLVHGDAEVLLKSAFRKVAPEKYRDVVQLISYSGGFAGEVSNVKVIGLDSLDEGLRITYHYHRPHYLDFQDHPPEQTLPLASLNLQSWNEKDDDVRLYASSGDLDYKCRIELPTGITAQVPLSVKLAREYATYESDYSEHAQVMTAERKITIIAPLVKGDHRQDYEAFTRAINADEEQQMVLHVPEGFLAKSGSGSDVDELMRQAEIEYRERNYADAYADFRRVADRDPKHKGVWTQIGLAEYALRHYEQAIGDFQKAIAADPYDAKAHAELGGAYLAAQRGGMAVPELNKAVEIDPLNHRAHYLLGWYYIEQKKDYQLAVPELEKALATESDDFNDEAQVRGFLADGYFKLKEPDKAVEQLKKVVDASPIPTTWNNAAYTLAENSYDLDLARQYADFALKGIDDRLNQIQSDAIRSTDLRAVQLLTMTWDTKGWVEFKTGNYTEAEKYVRAAWNLAQAREEAEHLGEIYEKLGRTKDAIDFYALAARPAFAMLRPVTPDPAREHLLKLVGRTRAEQLIREKAGEPSKMRTIPLGKIAPSGSKGEFYFVFSPGPTLADVELTGGDQRLIAPLRKQADKIAASVLFPEKAPEKLVRQGFVMCSAYQKSCDLVFYTSDTPARAGATTQR
jgi:tetratricopeptide (TPR) repeat protein